MYMHCFEYLRHILPNEETHGVHMVIPPACIHLLVLANRVEAKLLESDEVGLQGLIGRRRIQAVGEPALIQDSNLDSQETWCGVRCFDRHFRSSDLVERLIVEHNGWLLLPVRRDLSYRNLTHTNVGRHSVSGRISD